MKSGWQWDSGCFGGFVGFSYLRRIDVGSSSFVLHRKELPSLKLTLIFHFIADLDDARASFAALSSAVTHVEGDSRKRFFD